MIFLVDGIIENLCETEGSGGAFHIYFPVQLKTKNLKSLIKLVASSHLNQEYLADTVSS